MRIVVSSSATERGIRSKASSASHEYADRAREIAARQVAAANARLAFRKVDPPVEVKRTERIDPDEHIRSWFADAHAELEYPFSGVQTRHRITIRIIMGRISKATGVSIVDMRSPQRNRSAIIARQAVMYWARRLTMLSLPQIGHQLGNRHRTTVLYGIRKYPERRLERGRHVRPL